MLHVAVKEVSLHHELRSVPLLSLPRKLVALHDHPKLLLIIVVCRRRLVALVALGNSCVLVDRVRAHEVRIHADLWLLREHRGLCEGVGH